MSSPSLCRVSRRIGGGKSLQGGGRRRRCGLLRWHRRTQPWGRACASTRRASQTCWVPQMRLGGPSPTYADGGGVGGAAENQRANHRTGRRGGPRHHHHHGRVSPAIQCEDVAGAQLSRRECRAAGSPHSPYRHNVLPAVHRLREQGHFLPWPVHGPVVPVEEAGHRVAGAVA